MLPQNTEYTFQNDEITVTAVLSGTEEIPDHVKLCVISVTKEKNSEKFNRIRTLICGNAEQKHQTVTGFLAYDIYLAWNGIRFEPKMGTVSVSIRYKNKLFDSQTKQATDSVKVLLLPETGTAVEDVTDAVHVADIGSGTKQKLKTQSLSGSSAGDAVEFSADRFATFAVTGTAAAGSGISATLNFVGTDGNVDPSVNGTYYLYLKCSGYNSNEYRNTVALQVSSGSASVLIPGLYDQNGKTNQGSLYPLIDSSGQTVYTAVLFQYTGTGSNPVSIGGDFRWDENNYKAKGFVKYQLNSQIEELFTITEFPNTITVKNGSGKLPITATAKTGTKFSCDDLWSRLSPVLPYAVFADYFNLETHMEGCIAVNRARIAADFGNSNDNYRYYCSNKNVILVEKTYQGSEIKTFRFGLYDRSGSLVTVKTLTLPVNGKNNGTVSFDVGAENVNDYAVYELDGSNNVIRSGEEHDGFKLTKWEKGASQTNVLTMNSTSYIKDFEAIVGSHQLNTNSYAPNKLVIGSKYKIVNENQGKCVNYNGGKLSCSSAQTIVNAPPDFPIDIDAGLNQMAELSAALAQAVSSDTVKVRNFTVSQLDGAVFDVPANDGKMLLINIDATDAPVDASDHTPVFAFPSNLVWNTGGANVNWVPTAGNIIINVYQKQGDSYQAYSGKIKSAGRMIGTLLAPRADVLETQAVYNGRIIAKNATNDGGEIHSTAGGFIGESVVWTLENTESASVVVLPNTGGIGINIFYRVGGGMILLAAVWMAVALACEKQRKKRKRGV